jgi:hypothetical protein
LKLGGKIFTALVHVNSDSHHSQVGRFVLRAHLYKDAGYFVPIKLNVVGQLDRGLKAELTANHVRDSFDRPNCEPPRVAELDLGS